jgi:hypothetical protein
METIHPTSVIRDAVEDDSDRANLLAGFVVLGLVGGVVFIAYGLRPLFMLFWIWSIVGGSLLGMWLTEDGRPARA